MRQWVISTVISITVIIMFWNVVYSASTEPIHTVELEGIVFTPADINVNVGDTVHWVWISGFHNVESGIIDSNGDGVHDNNFRSGDPTITQGTIFNLVIDQAFLDANPMTNNVYPYYCFVHDFVDMAGTITVILIGDIDLDTDVDLIDHKFVISCLTGPDELANPDGCILEHRNRADIDGDGDVYMKDLAAMQLAFTG